MHLLEMDFVKKQKKYLNSYRKLGMSLMYMLIMPSWKHTGDFSNQFLLMCSSFKNSKLFYCGFIDLRNNNVKESGR